MLRVPSLNSDLGKESGCIVYIVKNNYHIFGYLAWKIRKEKSKKEGRVSFVVKFNMSKVFLNTAY